MFKLTSHHEKYWRERKINWKTSYFDTWNHPHRKLLIDKLRKMPFRSIMEVGCGAGENLYLIQKEFPYVEVGGIDINPDAIEVARDIMPLARTRFVVDKADDIYFSDKSVDVVLTDMTLIYMGPRKIKKVMDEITRIARNYVVLCEFHTANPLKAFLFWLVSGYWAYNYKKLLEKYKLYDIEITKIPLEAWPGGEPQKTFGYIATGRL